MTISGISSVSSFDHADDDCSGITVVFTSIFTRRFASDMPEFAG